MSADAPDGAAAGDGDGGPGAGTGRDGRAGAGTGRVPLGPRLALAALAGAAGAVASSPVEQTWAQWPLLALLLPALDGLPWRRALLVGWAAGASANLCLFSWLGVAAARFGELPWAVAGLALLVYVAACGAQYAVVAGLDALVRARRPGARRLLFPLAFVAVEGWWPQLFHWTMGAGQGPSVLVSQAAAWGGPLAVSLVLLAGACGLEAAATWAWAAARGARAGVAGGGPAPHAAASRAVAGRDALVLLGAVALALALGAWQRANVRSAPAARTVRVALVQPGVAWTPHGGVSHAEVEVALHRIAAEVAAAGPVDLALWPESAPPWPLIRLEPGGPAQVVRAVEAEAARRRDVLAGLVRRGRAPAVLGVTEIDVACGPTLEASRVVRARNLLVAHDALGREVDRYAKHELLVFGEYLPLEGALPWLRTWLPTAGNFEAGPAPRALEVAGLRLGPLICYEAVPGRPARRLVREHEVDLLVNATNDVWFAGTQGPGLHAMIARLRAIETRRPFLRATTTGISQAVSAAGDVVATIPWGEAAVRAVDLTLPARPGDSAEPLAVRAGDALAWLAPLALALALALRRGRPA